MATRRSPAAVSLGTAILIRARIEASPMPTGQGARGSIARAADATGVMKADARDRL
ncbi:MAG: hypothetical protein ABTD50_13730 [Polyangiaceae bacterium]